MECKGSYLLKKREMGQCIKLTKVECKVYRIRDQLIESVSIKLTKVECKVEC